MLRSARNTACVLGFGTALIASACGSADEGTGGAAGAAGSAGSRAGAPNHGGSAGSAGAQGGTTGLGGTGAAFGGNAALGGSVANAGQGGSGAGTAGSNAGSAAQAGAGADGGESGQAGSASTGPREFAYVSTIQGGLHEFEINASTGVPEPLAGSPVGPSSAAPCSVVVDPTGHFFYEADIDHAALITYRLGDDGALSSDPLSTVTTDQEPDAIALGAAGKFLYLGSTNGIEPYALDANGIPTVAGDPVALTAAVGSLAVAPSGHVLYATQWATKGVRAFDVDPDSGALLEQTGSPFATDLSPSGGLVISADGKFLYLSGNGLNAFSVDASGALTLLAGSPFSLDVGTDPFASNLAFANNGQFLYATSFLAQTISAFAVAADGTLARLTGFPMQMPAPYSLAVDPASRFLYVGIDDSDEFAVFRIADNGTLSLLGDKPFPAQGFQPEFAFTTRP